MASKIIVAVSLSILLSHCSPITKKISSIRVQGSDTMIIMVSLWAEEYMKLHENVSIYAAGGGSSLGISALIDGKIDICATSRPLLPHEIRNLAEKHNRLGISFLVAKDALSIYLNPLNPVKTLTIEQLKQIYTGEINNWLDVGGENSEIYVINRSSNSGTFSYFRERLLDDESYVDVAKICYSTQEVVNTVIENKNAIGYGGTAYGPEVYHCRINGVAPTTQNVIDDKYPIIRYLYLYTIDTPRGNVAGFIDWILSEFGQSIVARSGYIPLWRRDSL